VGIVFTITFIIYTNYIFPVCAIYQLGVAEVYGKMVESKFVEKELVSPKLMLYTPQHAWATITPEGNIRVGLTDHAQKRLKGIAKVLTEPVGKEIEQNEPVGVAETWMFMFDLYAPVSGKIAKVNERLDEEPYIVNDDPYGKGWTVEIKPHSAVLEKELKRLLSAVEYNKQIVGDV
jgi:glycine cleavage system H protein